MDLSTKYLGLDLKHPVVASPSPLSADLDGVLRLADAGAAAVVMASIYEEQIVAEELRHAALTDQGADSQPEAAGYFPTQFKDRGVLEAGSKSCAKRRSGRAFRSSPASTANPMPAGSISRSNCSKRARAPSS